LENNEQPVYDNDAVYLHSSKKKSENIPHIEVNDELQNSTEQRDDLDQELSNELKNNFEKLTNKAAAKMGQSIIKP
jgi:hypothetical protein